MKTARTYSAKLENLDAIYADTESFCEQNGVDSASLFALNLCLDEIFTNIVSYGYKNDDTKKVEIELEINGNVLSAKITDSAPPFDPITQATPPDITADAQERDVGGLGIYFIKKNMDGVSYRYVDGKNELTISKKISK